MAQKARGLFNITVNHAILAQELPVKLFEGIDARTQDKLMERIILLHQLSFNVSDKLPASVMFFELLHQILAYRGRTSSTNVESYLINLSGLRRTLGEPLYAYLITLEDHAIITATKATPQGPEPCKILGDTELSIVFRWFAQIKNLKEAGASDDISPYYVQNSFVSAQHLPPEIELFANLSSKMEYR